jgi:DNA-cytosine methyltransferase
MRLVNYLDLFAGIGGFAPGALRAGMEFERHYFSEVDKYAISVYKKRFPGAVFLGDIRDISGSALPRGDWLLTGGFPCQDISTAGKGAGLDGDRPGLWFEYARLIGELRPAVAVMENVGALVVRGLDRVLGSLAEIGYDAVWQDIRASDMGAPHRRERIWIVAYPEGERCRGAGPCELRRMSPKLPLVVRLWPIMGTPLPPDWKKQIREDPHCETRFRSGGKLNPMWVEWLMGFPVGWTDLNV